MTNKDRASRQDKRVANITGLKVRPNSGAVSGYKGDLGGPDIFVETKTGYSTPGKLTIQKAWLVKAEKQAFSMGKPLWCIIVSPDEETDYVIIDYLQLLDLKRGHLGLYKDLSSFVGSASVSIQTLDIDRSIYACRKADIAPIATFNIPGDRTYAILYVEDFANIYKSSHDK